MKLFLVTKKNKSESTLKKKFEFLDKHGFDLLSGLLRYFPGKRYESSSIVKHSYFRVDPLPKKISEMPVFKDWKSVEQGPPRVNKNNKRTGSSRLRDTKRQKSSSEEDFN